jgi:hypothetical protein
MPEHESPGPTVIESFSTKLPYLGPSNKYENAKASGTTTASAKPPKLLLCGSPKHLETLADEHLNTKEIQANDATNRYTGSNFQASTDKSEADVVAAFNVYIFGAIAEVVNIIYPGQWTYGWECTESACKKESTPMNDDTNAKPSDTKGMGNVQAKAKPKMKPKTKSKDDVNLRYDLVFRTRPTGATKGKTLAVIEFKKSGQIVYDNFEPVLVTESSNDHDDRIAEGVDMATNALAYTKQVCMYARTRDCPHVALFNWEHLLLYNFHELAEAGTRTKDTSGRKAKLIWVCEDGDTDGTFMNHCHIRKALLGWLLNAFAAHVPAA